MNWRTSLVICSISAFAVSCGSRSETTKTVSAEYASTESLAEVEDLTNSGIGWKLIDLRKPEEFQQGHISGAQNVWRTDITDTTFPYGGMMPTQLHMELLLSKLGIEPSDTILIYDEKAECDAARLWWVLKFYRHPHIKLLNGGLAAWKASSQELTTSTKPSKASKYVFESEPDSSLLITFQSVKSIDDSTLVLIDTRGDDEYSGKFHKEGTAYPGHIDGAVNLDWASTVEFNGSHKFKSAKELKEIFAVNGVNETTPVITYCHSGVRSAHTLFVLKELLGYRNIKNYDGSWIEWSHLHNPLSR